MLDITVNWSGHTYRGMGEDHGGYVAVVQLQVWFIIKQSVGQSSACSDGDGSQESLPGYIAEGVEAGYVGVLELVHHDVTGLVQGEADVWTAETVSVRNSAHSPEEDVSGGELLSSVEGHHQAITGLLNSLNTNTSLNIDSTSLHLSRHSLTDLVTMFSSKRSLVSTQLATYHLIKVPEDCVSSDTQRGVRSQSSKDLSHLHPNIAGTHHDHPTRTILQLEKPVASDAEFCPRNVGEQGSASNSHQYVVSRVDSGAHSHLLLSNKLGLAGDHFNLGVV